MTLEVLRHGAARPGSWRTAALALAVLGVAAATWFVFAVDSDPGGVLWPLVVAPAFIALVPVLVPVSPARIGAMVALGAWCFVTGFSIGFLLLPALAALVGAVLREGR